MIKLDKRQALWNERTMPANLETIDISLRYLQMILAKLKGELSVVAVGGEDNGQYADMSWEEIVPFRFSDEEKRCNIQGIQHMTDKAIIHAHHCIEHLRTIQEGKKE